MERRRDGLESRNPLLQGPDKVGAPWSLETKVWHSLRAQTLVSTMLLVNSHSCLNRSCEMLDEGALESEAENRIVIGTVIKRM